MTDLFSVASGAIGVISLGLTVCDGLVSYVSTFKGQDQYLDNLSQRADGLNNCLNLLNRSLPSLRTGSADVTIQVEQSLEVCRPSLSLLEDKLASFRQAQGPSLRKDKFKHAAKKAVFPFKRDTLVELSGAIDSLQLNLDTILAVGNLEVASTQLNTQHGIDAKLSTVVAASGVLGADMQVANQGISSLQVDLSIVQKDIQSVQSSLDPGLQTMLQRFDELSKQIDRLSIHPAPSAHTVQQACAFQCQLISKPSLLASLCQETPRTQSIQQSRILAPSGFPSLCSCPSYRSRRKPGNGVVFFDYHQSSEHDEDCHLYIKRKKRHVNLKISWSSTLISRCVQIMAGLTSGAGGTSISANLDWAPIVPWNSPAISLVQDAVGRVCHSEQPQVELENLRIELLRLFAQRKAHPKEMDEDGVSLFSIAILSFRPGVFIGMKHSSQFDEIVKAFFCLITTFANLGARVPIGDLVDIAFLSESHEADFGIVTNQMVQIGAIELDPTKLASCMSFHLIAFPEWHHVFDSGPLSRHIMNRDLFGLTQLLHKKQSGLFDIDDLDYSALHLSTLWPLGLVILLKFGGSQLVNRKDKSGRSPLLYAMYECTKRNESLVATKLLIAAGAAICDSEIACTGFIFLLPRLLRRKNMSTVRVLLDALVYRRQRLRDLAQSSLSRHFWGDGGRTNEGVLDEQAYNTGVALSNAGISIPAACATPERQQTLYHYIKLVDDSDVAQKLYDAGFRDTDGQNHQGHTPLMSLHLDDWLPRGSNRSIGKWLCDHGADLFRPLPQCNDDCTGPPGHRRPGQLKVIHAIAGNQGYDPPFYTTVKFAIWRSEHMTKLLTSEDSDGCSCACSEQGCFPGLNVLAPIIEMYALGYIPWGYLRAQLSSSFNPFFTALIRFWTFEALELTHTCCRHGWGRYKSRWYKPCEFSIPSEEEVQEIQEEERELISFHNSLVAEFTDIWLGSSWTVKGFMSKIWKPRMRRITQERSKLSPEEMAEMYRLGVRNIRMVDVTEDASDPLDNNDYELSQDECGEEDDDEDEDYEDDELASEEGEEGGSLSDEEDDPEEEAEAEEAEDEPYNGQTIEGIDDVEVAEILREAARVNGLEDYDVWFKMIGRPDPRLRQASV